MYLGGRRSLVEQVEVHVLLLLFLWLRLRLSGGGSATTTATASGGDGTASRWHGGELLSSGGDQLLKVLALELGQQLGDIGRVGLNTDGAKDAGDVQRRWASLLPPRTASM